MFIVFSCDSCTLQSFTQIASVVARHDVTSSSSHVPSPHSVTSRCSTMSPHTRTCSRATSASVDLDHNDAASVTSSYLSDFEQRQEELDAMLRRNERHLSPLSIAIPDASSAPVQNRSRTATPLSVTSREEEQRVRRTTVTTHLLLSPFAAPAARKPRVASTVKVELGRVVSDFVIETQRTVTSLQSPKLGPKNINKTSPKTLESRAHSLSERGAAESNIADATSCPCNNLDVQSVCDEPKQVSPITASFFLDLTHLNVNPPTATCTSPHDVTNFSKVSLEEDDVTDNKVLLLVSWHWNAHFVSFCRESMFVYNQC